MMDADYNEKADDTIESIARFFRDPERLRILSGKASSSFEDELVAGRVRKAEADPGYVQELVDKAKDGSVASYNAVIKLAALVDSPAIQRYLLALHLKELKVPSKPGAKRDWARDNLIMSWVSQVEKLGFKATRNPANVQTRKEGENEGDEDEGSKVQSACSLVARALKQVRSELMDGDAGDGDFPELDLAEAAIEEIWSKRPFCSTR